ncbi:hypothetical protein LQ948_15320 [Jiella sp. MQZ9-1]|uniref:Anti-sigma factor NepR domain-containing protein n=1 Tax=Jiella flava TaxID=2816857 RepID=A0A939G2S0_9HYPH|nr:NepR family anti-sigma factor [Jiella flava]MBO0664004.1 hypothetical protein [Jiella flava]MCD2472575.1 hypothetical protein [Jiella flava]
MSDREKEDRNVQTGQAAKSLQPAPGLGINAAIGRQLKAYYDDVASEPVPDRFLSLLDALDKAESASKSNNRE